MANRAHRNAIVNLKDFLSRLAERDKENSITVPDRRDRAPRGQLCFDVLAPVGDRFDPAIRLFDHATVSLKIAATFCSGKVAIPSPETILMSG